MCPVFLIIIEIQFAVLLISNTNGEGPVAFENAFHLLETSVNAGVRDLPQISSLPKCRDFLSKEPQRNPRFDH
jgi:hypothetical protein